MTRQDLAALAGCLLLAACAGPGAGPATPAPPPEPRHQRSFTEDTAAVCAASRAVLLGEGYVVEARGSEGYVGARETPVSTDDDKNDGYTHLRVYVTCLPRATGTVLFVTATEEHFGVKAIRDSTLVGLPLISPISVGSRSEGDHQVKFRGRTIEEQNFYDRFYQSVRATLAPRAPTPPK